MAGGGIRGGQVYGASDRIGGYPQEGRVLPQDVTATIAGGEPYTERVFASTKDLKMVAIAKEAGAPYVLPSIPTVNDKSYAIARDLYMYTNGEPDGIIKEYLDWILSDEAQEIVAELGFVPVN
jgi:ABC-type phosphate transport system substrate-binding protein